LTAAPAFAKSDSIVTFGLGTHGVMTRLGSISPGGATALTGGMGLSARLRLLYFLGAEFSYELTGSTGIEPVNVPKPVYQLSLLIYPYTSRRVAVFLLAGLGSQNITDIVNVGGGTTSYHGGLGLEVGLTPHWMIAADGRINLPGYQQLIDRIEPAAMLTHGSDAILRYYNLDSFQINLGIRYYL
jgi:hypothetical protein